MEKAAKELDFAEPLVCVMPLKCLINNQIQNLNSFVKQLLS